jgi:TRAP-type C4-dicarboxylate transport system permease small subunit
MKTIKKISDQINDIIEYIALVLLFAMVIVVFLQVIFRFVLHNSLSWSEEFARYTMIWLSFLGISIGVKKKAHVGVEIFTNLAKGIFKKVIIIFAYVASFTFFFILIYYGYKILSITKMQTSPSMGISMAIPYSAIFWGAFISFIHLIVLFWEDLHDFQHKKS